MKGKWRVGDVVMGGVWNMPRQARVEEEEVCLDRWWI